MNYTSFPVTLAPMAGYTDSTFRLLCQGYGADSTVSEMISATALVMGDRKTAALAKIAKNERVWLQIFGHDSRIMAKAAEILLSGDFPGRQYGEYPLGIDINMGCPVRKIYSSGDGSALLENSALAGEIVGRCAEVCRRFGVPLSVKIRLGIDGGRIVAAEFAKVLADAGADKITLHCRTKEQMYAPVAHPEYCLGVKLALVSARVGDAHGCEAEVGKNGAAYAVNPAEVGDAVDSANVTNISADSAESSTIRTINSVDSAGSSVNPTNSRVVLCGNGDIVGRESALVYLENGCDEVAVGRGALGQPWIFREIKDSASPKMEKGEILEVAKAFVSAVAAEKGETVGIRESRSRAAHFIKGMPGSAKVRDRLNHAETVGEFCGILDELKD